MSLTSKITSDLMAAMKARDQERLDALRMVQAAFKNAQIDLGHELSDDEAIKVISRLIKQRREAAEQYRAGGRAELADKEAAEAKLLASYLPQQISDDELKKIVEEVITQIGATGPADAGRVIGAVIARVKGSADGNRVAAIVRTALS